MLVEKFLYYNDKISEKYFPEKIHRKNFSEIFNVIFPGRFHKYLNLNIKFHKNILNLLI